MLLFYHSVWGMCGYICTLTVNIYRLLCIIVSIVSVVPTEPNTFRVLMSQGTSCIEGFMAISCCWECSRVLHLISGLMVEILT